MKRFTTIFVPLLLLAGCRATFVEPDSPVELEREWGTAAAESEAEAERIAEIVETTLDVYRDLPGFADGELRVHFGEFRRPSESFVGVAVQPEAGAPWVAVSPRSKQVEHTTAHEMAHYYFREVSDVFPLVLEEGFCDLLAERVYRNAPSTKSGPPPPCPQSNSRRCATTWADTHARSSSTTSSARLSQAAFI